MSAAALRGGQWMPRNGVLVWTPFVKPSRAAIWKLVACPTCRARIGQSCRTVTGHTTRAHQSRIVPRLCVCGSRLSWKRRLCDPCRASATRESKRRRARLDQEAKNAWGRAARARRARCGTDSGYYRHRRGLREPACFECLEAHRVASLERKHRDEEAA